MQTATEHYHNEPDITETAPVLRKTIIYDVAFAALFTGTLFWTAFYLLNPGSFPVRQVRIEGEFRQLSTGALEALVRDKVTGGFFNIDVAAVRDALLREPWVKEVSVHRIWPDSLQVFVTEQRPVARWKTTGLLNKTGDLFMPEPHTFPADLPVLDGPEGSHALILKKFYFLQGQSGTVDMNITFLKQDERRAWQFETDNGLLVSLGRERFEERIERFVKLVPQNLGARLGLAAMVDMRYPNGFAVRWKQGGIQVLEEDGAL